jgi:cell division protein FtsN
VDLAEAEVAPVATPSGDSVEMVNAPEAPVEAVLAAAIVPDDETATLSDVGPVGAPLDPGIETVLPDAAVAPVEVPEFALDEVNPPAGEPISAELAEASIGDVDLPESADLGSSEPGFLPELEAVLAEAAPPESETPDGSLAGASPGTPEEVEVAAIEPTPLAEVTDVAEEPIGSPEEIPADAVLSLEPADFRPPEYPEPDDESLLARESPAEEPEVVAVLETPAPESAVEVAVVPTEEPAADVPAEPVEAPVVVAVAPEPVAEIASLPVVTELLDENYYLQIGAYTAPATAQVAVDALSSAYPMAVLPIDSRGRTVYRVLVGPLEQDETGTLLLWLRAKGYRDTFIRSGTEL